MGTLTIKRGMGIEMRWLMEHVGSWALGLLWGGNPILGRGNLEGEGWHGWDSYQRALGCTVWMGPPCGT